MAIDQSKNYVIVEHVTKFRCLSRNKYGKVCGHTWEPRKGIEPVKCPRCLRFDWKGDDESMKYVIVEQVIKLRCLASDRDGKVCGHIWEPRRDVEPVKCPRCQRFEWRGDDE
jgi:hypothetical protein